MSDFELREQQFLLDAQEHALHDVERDYVVEPTLTHKTASIILKIARQKQKLLLPMDAREIANEAVETLMSLRSMAFAE